MPKVSSKSVTCSANKGATENADHNSEREEVKLLSPAVNPGSQHWMTVSGAAWLASVRAWMHAAEVKQASHPAGNQCLELQHTVVCLCCAVPCCAVLRFAVLRFAVLRYAVLCRCTHDTVAFCLPFRAAMKKWPAINQQLFKGDVQQTCQTTEASSGCMHC